MKRAALIIPFILFLAVPCLSCSGAKKIAKAKSESGSLDYDRLIISARDAARISMDEKDSGKAMDLALKGKGYAERAIESGPDRADGYYWRAVATGLFHKVRILGYQRGIKQMISDCQKVIEINPYYDYAGAYRILGEIYTQLPQTGGTADSVVRDLRLAEQYLRRAVELAPDYPENYLTLAKTLYEEEKIAEALESLARAGELTPKWKNDYSYNEWQISMTTLRKKINKAVK